MGSNKKTPVLNIEHSNLYKILMDIKIISNTRNELLSRNEVAFTVTYEGATPSRADVRAKIAAIQNSPVENLILAPFERRFGSRAVNDVARIYDSPEELKATEHEYLISRGIIQKQKKD